MRLSRAVVTAVLVVLSASVGVVAGAAGVVMNPTVLCGDTPGFCPNPPPKTTRPVTHPVSGRAVPAPGCPECGRF